MNVAQHAERILAAWSVADPVSFELELENALDCCRRTTPQGHLEYEQQEVLETVVERLRSIGAPAGGRRGLHAVQAGPARFKESSNASGLHAGFALLEHLRQRAVA